MNKIFSRLTFKNLLIGLIVLVILVLAIEGVYWLQLNKKLKETPEAAKPPSRKERWIEEPVEGLTAKDVVKLVGKVVSVEGNLITLEVKEGTRQIALDRETTFFTTFGGATETVEAGGPEAIKVGNEVNVVYQRPKEGEIPTAISVLVIY